MGATQQRQAIRLVQKGAAMNTSMISGVLGGLIASAFVVYASARSRRPLANGELRFGWLLGLVGLGCSLLAGLAGSAFFVDNDVWTDRGEFIAVVSLLVGFGLGAIYTFAEYFLVRGRADNDGIELRTPWTGRKTEKWQDLLQAAFNPQTSWYVLEFKSGTRIRVSSLLSGHGAVLDQLAKRGIHLD